MAGWLGTSYLLSTATFTPLYGRLADITGRRVASLLSLSLFALGTLGCGGAPSMLFLIISRGVAGMGGGGMMAVSSIVASDLVPLKKRGLTQGLGAPNSSPPRRHIPRLTRSIPHSQPVLWPWCWAGWACGRMDRRGVQLEGRFPL